MRFLGGGLKFELNVAYRVAAYKWECCLVLCRQGVVRTGLKEERKRGWLPLLSASYSHPLAVLYQ